MREQFGTSHFTSRIVGGFGEWKREACTVMLRARVINTDRVKVSLSSVRDPIACAVLVNEGALRACAARNDSLVPRFSRGYDSVL